MGNLLKLASIIGFIQSAMGDWDVFHHVGPGEVDEEKDTVEDAQGEVSIGFSRGKIVLKGNYVDEDAKVNRFRGEAGIVRLKVVESITWDGEETQKDDIYASSHLTGDNPQVLLEFRFAKDGTAHRVRFVKELGEDGEED